MSDATNELFGVFSFKCCKGYNCLLCFHLVYTPGLCCQADGNWCTSVWQMLLLIKMQTERNKDQNNDSLHDSVFIGLILEYWFYSVSDGFPTLLHASQPPTVPISTNKVPA